MMSSGHRCPHPLRHDQVPSNDPETAWLSALSWSMDWALGFGVYALDFVFLVKDWLTVFIEHLCC